MFRKSSITVASAMIAAAMLPTPASAAVGSTVPADYFGMTVHSIGYGQAFPNPPIGSVRLWDTGTLWKDIEKERGVYDWSVLDTAVTIARLNHASVLYTFGGTPIFYAKNPNAATGLGAGASSPTNDLGAYRKFVTAVATRYKGRISSYEEWNEADIQSYWSGTQAEMLTQNRIAYQAIKSVDPKAIVTSPSFVDRTASAQNSGLITYMKAGGSKWADAISYHPYGMPSYGPEQDAYLIRSLRIKLRAIGVTKPIWTTEQNYGLPYGPDYPMPTALSNVNRQAAYVTRTYLLQWGSGARRIYWYSWSNAPHLGVKITDNISNRPAAAFTTVRNWMRGRYIGCTSTKNGTWTCTILYRKGSGVIKWNPSHEVYVAAPAHTVEVRNQYGQRKVLYPKHNHVGFAPVLFRIK